MRKIALFALTTALLGTVATVQANDQTSPIVDEPALTQTASNDDDGNRDQRRERADHRRDRHDEAREHGRKSHDNDQHEGHKHRR